MAGLDDLFKGMQMFTEGLTQYQTSQAVNDAGNKLNELNAQQLKESEAIAARAEVGRQLDLRLAGIGTNHAQAKQATDSISVPASTTATNQFQKETQVSKQKFDSEQNALNRESNEKIAGIRSAGQKKMDQRHVSFLQKTQGDFDKQAKKPLESLNFINLAREALKSDNPVADQAVVNFAARASSEVGPLTESDKAIFGGSKALMEKLKQFDANVRTSKFTKENRQLMTQLMNTFEKSNKGNIKQIQSQIAKRASVVAKAGNLELDEAAIASALYQEQAPERIATRKAYYPKVNKTVIEYSDGTQEEFDGKK